MGTSRTFLSWFRSGLGSMIGAGAQVALGADRRARLELAVRAQINGEAEVDDPADERPKFYLYGPGDVLGFDAKLVVSQWPPHLSAGADPTYFPTIEFAAPDLPWAFSPGAPDRDRLNPWLCLIAVEKRDGRIAAPGGSRPLPSLRVRRAELPDLAESWAWAHVQQTHDDADTSPILERLTHFPERTLSRLMCPRLLRDSTTYLACVVPVYLDGVEAGGGSGDPATPGATETAALAWTDDPTDRELSLPVYHSWEFSTGVRGNFEVLAKKLQRRRLPVDAGQPVGTRPLDLSQAGQGLVPSTPGAKPLLGGALGSGPPTTFTDAPWQHRLAELVNARTRPAGSDLAVAAPCYGRWHAAAAELDAASTTRTPWLGRLNLDPRYRVAAALGTKVVQDRQDELMAQAWEQVAEVQAANQIIRQGQLAAAVGQSHHDKLSATDVSDVAVVALTAPAHLRVVAPPGTVERPLPGAGVATVRTAIARSDVPAAAFGGAFRRLARPRGPLARRAGARNAGAAPWNESLLDRLNGGPNAAGKPRVGLDSDGGATLVRSTTDADRRAELDRFFTAPPKGKGATADTRALVDALHLALKPIRPRPVEPPQPRRLAFDQLAIQIKTTLDPKVTVIADVNARLVLPGGPLNALDVILAAPEFSDPMYKDLLRLSPEWLLPGVGNVPPNTIAGLYPNNAFIEAYLVGLNHEMARELLWRGYPTDQRGTYFKQFWDPSGRVPLPADRAELLDLRTPIHEWQSDLGEHLASGGSGYVFLMIRGELLQRFPRAAIYIIPAKRVGGQRVPDESATATLPEIRAFMPPDTTFLGFRIAAAQAKGEPGAFFVIEQPPMEPRFGLDEGDGVAPTAWNELDWDDVALNAGGYIRLAGGLGAASPPTPPRWDTSSTAAQLAEITLQTAVRIAIHAGNVLP